MDTAPITREEHEEFSLRMNEENERQNKRLDLLEQSVRDMEALAASVEKLAVNMQNMLKEQEKQGTRLENLEKRDGEMWRKTMEYVVSALIGIILGYLFSHLGL